MENEFAELDEIPICQVEDLPPVPPPVPVPVAAPAPPPPQRAHLFQLPATELLNEIPGRTAYDEQELKDIAAQIKIASSKSSTCSATWCRSTRARW